MGCITSGLDISGAVRFPPRGRGQSRRNVIGREQMKQAATLRADTHRGSAKSKNTTDGRRARVHSPHHSRQSERRDASSSSGDSRPPPKKQKGDLPKKATGNARRAREAEKGAGKNRTAHTEQRASAKPRRQGPVPHDSSGSSSSGDEQGRQGRATVDADSSEGEENSTWEMIKPLWAMEDRPAIMKSKTRVNRMDIGQAMKYKELFDSEQKKMGMAGAEHGRDQRVRSTKYPAMRDNGRDKLHPARTDRMPFVEPKEYWAQMPLKREQIYRHVQLAHLGAEGQVKESVIVKMHDASVPVTISMLQGPNFIKVKKTDKRDEEDEPVGIWQIHEAMCNYSAVMHTLWPYNYAPLVLTQVLVDNR